MLMKNACLMSLINDKTLLRYHVYFSNRQKTVVIAYVFKLHCDDIFGRHVDSLNLKNVTRFSNSTCMWKMHVNSSSSPSTNQSPSTILMFWCGTTKWFYIRFAISHAIIYFCHIFICWRTFDIWESHYRFSNVHLKKGQGLNHFLNWVAKYAICTIKHCTDCTLWYKKII